MGQQGSLTIPELQQPTEVKAAAAKFHDRPNSPFSEATGRWWEIISPSLTSYFSISFPALFGYQTAWTEWNLLSSLSPPFPGSWKIGVSLAHWKVSLQCQAWPVGEKDGAFFIAPL